MPDYSKSKIYQVVAPDESKYIGSTVQDLSKRYIKHKSKYKEYKNNKYHLLTIFNLFDKFGVDNCKIQLIEEYSCTTKKELEEREGYHIRTIKCVNKRIEGRSGKEWRDSNSVKLKQYWKDRHQENGDKKREQMKAYYHKNIEAQRQRLRDNHHKRKAINELLSINFKVLQY